MLRMFNYRKSDDNFNAIVDGTLELGVARFEGKNVPDYKEKNSNLLNAMGKQMVEGTRYEEMFEEKGLEIFKNPNVRLNSTVRENFNMVLAQVTTAIVPIVVNETLQNYIAEIHQVGWGETARFQIESNDLFKVNSKAEGVRKGVDQPMYDDEITVNARPIEISTHIDWYPFAAGVFDMGNFALKIGRSFMAYIFIKAVNGMTVAETAFGAAYSVNGADDGNFATLKNRVSAANGGMNCVAIGTELAVSKLHLKDDSNLVIGLGEEMNKIGYLNQYLGVPIVALKNVLVPGTTNGTADLALDDKKVYLVPVAGQRPVKIVFEGNETIVAYNPDETSDTRYGFTITMRVGMSAICGAKYGTIKVA